MAVTREVSFIPTNLEGKLALGTLSRQWQQVGDGRKEPGLPASFLQRQLKWERISWKLANITLSPST